MTERYEGNQQFQGMGVMRWCAICAIHRPLEGGHLGMSPLGRQWVCGKHEKPPKKPKPRVPKGYTAKELERDNPYNAWMYES